MPLLNNMTRLAIVCKDEIFHAYVHVKWIEEWKIVTIYVFPFISRIEIHEISSEKEFGIYTTKYLEYIELLFFLLLLFNIFNIIKSM